MKKMLIGIALVSAITACSSSASNAKSITLVTHDSFTPSKGVIEKFTADTGIAVKIVNVGDAGQLVSKAVLTKDHPLGDVMFGVDNTFLSRALDNKLFTEYKSPGLSQVDPSVVKLVPGNEATPIDIGDVCINADIGGLQAKGVTVPASLDEVVGAKYKDQLVVENPATSSTGLAFLLGTIAQYGDKWPDWWAKAKTDGVKIVDGWTQAYEGEFSGSALGKTAGGKRTLVVSYASSPPAEVISANPKPAQAPTTSILSSCFRQVEFAAVMKGTTHTKEARKFIDFLLSTDFQSDLPLAMFVFPARIDITLPAEYVKFAPKPTHVLSLPSAAISANRDKWIEQWSKIMLG